MKKSRFTEQQIAYALRQANVGLGLKLRVVEWEQGELHTPLRIPQD